MDLTITPPHGYQEVAHARWMWADPGCDRCDGTGIVWTDVWDHGINEYAPLCREDNDCDCVWTPDEDVLEELDRRYQSRGNPDRARDAWESIAKALGPRRPGGWYWSRYWRAGYTVVSIDYSFHDGDPASPSWTITVRWDDGHHTTHCTPWDFSQDSCDRPPARHPGPSPVAPDLHSAAPVAASGRGMWSRLMSGLRSHR